MLERDQSCRIGLKPFWRLCYMILLDGEYHVHGSIIMMKKLALSCQRSGHLLYTTSHGWCRMSRWNSWFAISSLGGNPKYIKQWTCSSHSIYSVIRCLVFGMVRHSSWNLLVCFDIVSILSCLTAVIISLLKFLFTSSCCTRFLQIFISFFVQPWEIV